MFHLFYFFAFYFCEEELTFDCYRWDEWVPENRLLKFNEENLELQKKLLLTHAATSHGGSTSKASNKSTAGGSASTRGRKEGTRGTKRAREDVRSFSILSLSRALFRVLNLAFFFII